MQDLNAPANPLETLAYIIAQQISDHSVVYIGTGIPMVAGFWPKTLPQCTQFDRWTGSY